MEIKLPVVAVLLMAATPAIAGVPPEVPASRTSQIFSPFIFSFHDDGESVFKSGGPSCLDYSVINDFRQTADPTHGITSQAGFPQFVQELNTATGLQFYSSHGRVGVFEVEAFTTGQQGQNDATNQLINYQNSGTAWAPLATEAVVDETPDGFFTIGVTSGYIARILGMTQQAVVFNSSCDSFSVKSGYSSPNIRGYFGYSQACNTTGGADASNVFNTMSGIQPINGSYQNFTLGTGYLTANALDSILQFQPNTQSANGIRLYNAPRIVFAQVTQDIAGNGSFSNVIYNYPPGTSFAGSYPYGSGTTDYPGAPGNSGFAKISPTLINLRFSEPMNPSSIAFGVQLQFSDGTSQDVTSSGQWRTNILPNDSWSATVNLPGNVPNGKVVVAVRAQKVFCNPGQDVNNQDLDTTGSGSSVPGNVDQSINFNLVTTPPDLTVQDSYGTLPYYAVTTNNQISGTAMQTVAQVATLNIFQNGSTSPLATVPGLPASQASFNKILPVSSWYWVQSCDVVQNCALTAFCIDSPSGSFCNSSNVPPAPGAPPGGNQATPPSIPATLPSAHPVAGQPACLSLSPNPATSVSGCLPVILAQIPSSSYLVAHDPNFMTGPNGSVTPGQLMTYTIEFENTGSGTALDIFIGDVLDPSLDDTTLSLTNMFSLTFSSGGAILGSTPTTFPFTYDSQTRTVTLLAGNAGPLQGGSFVLQAKLRSTAVPGTIIRNQALVNFPNALEQVTPTNTIVSAVPLPTQLANVGASSGTYLSAVGLATQLTAAGIPINEQSVGFQDFGTSTTALTNSSGTATTSVSLSSAAGNYNLGFSYAGDGFYYLPTTASPSFTINTRATLLQVPYASARVGDTIHLTLTLSDYQGQALTHQVDEPKTVFLETINNLGTVMSLTSSLLSGTTVSFQFFLPQPLQLKWPLRARFGGDSHYTASISTGLLSLIDDTPPVITIQSPSGGQFYNGASVIHVNFSVIDESDPSPSATAYLIPLSSGQPLGVTNGAAIPASSLVPGAWALQVNAVDWAGNASQATTPSFQVTSDVLPPRTSLIAGAPSFSSSTLYATQATSFTLTAVDDLSVIGDGAGVGVAQTFISIDTSVFSVYSGTFSLTGQGLHTIQFFSTDLAGHTEIAHSSSVAVDLIPPVTTLTVSSPSYSGFVSTATLFLLSALDPVVNGVASGVALTQYRINGGALVSSPAVSVVAEATEWADFVSASGQYKEYNVANWWNNQVFAPRPFIRWDLAQIPARSSVNLSYQLRVRNPAAGGPGAHQQIGNPSVQITTPTQADQIFASFQGGTP